MADNMEPGALRPKRKGSQRANTGSWLYPGDWRFSKKGGSVSRSSSPSASGTSTQAAANTNETIRTSQNPQNLDQWHQPQEYNDRPHTTEPSPQPHHTAARGSPDTTLGANNLIGDSAGTAWSGLEDALQKLRITTDFCLPFRSAVDDLASCLHLFEAAAKNRQDYDDLATGLKSLVGLLIKHLNNAPSDDIIESVSAISELIRKEIESIGTRQSRNGLRRVLGASGDEEDLIRRYRRIEQLFRQINGEASMSTWNITSKHYISTQFDRLKPARLARFDSSLSTEINRRACTENTRTEILQQSMAWSEDSNAAKIYWMNGMAGTGKTTIACSLCTQLEARKQLAASFFCSRTSPECRDAKRIVPTIAYQFGQCSTPFRSALCKAVEENPDISSRNISSQFELLLKRPLLKVKDKLPDNFVVIVDALDECSDPCIVELFLGLLFQSIGELPIKFYVTSRPEPVIRNRMMSGNERSRSILYLHEIEKSLVQADIELYLREELSSISPSDPSIQKLAEHAGSLFIYAATAVRYIRPRRRAVDSHARLSAVLGVNTGLNQKLPGIDALYSAILAAAIDDCELELEEQTRIKLVLWTTICSCEPIGIATLSVLCGLDGMISTMNALESLRSVLHISDHTGIVTTLHASFPDYMFTKERSGPFFCDKSTHSQFLVRQCFDVMRAQLRFNICSIKSPFNPDDEVPELGMQINANISEELYYSCRFWADHLSQTGPVGALIPLIRRFLSQQLLFWIEVLNLKRCLITGAVNMIKLNKWLRLAQIHLVVYPGLLELSSGAHKFVANYISSPAMAYTPHIYLTALPLTSPSNPVRLCYLPRFDGLVKASGALLNKLGESSLGTWESDCLFCSAALSPSGELIALGDDSGKISIQNAYTGKYLVRPYQAHNGRITDIAVSNNGMRMLSSSWDMTLCIWSMQDGSLSHGPFKGHTNLVTSAGFSPNGAHVVSGSHDCKVGVWNAHDATVPMRSFIGHTKPVRSVSFSPDGMHIVSGSNDQTARVWELSSGATILILNHLKDFVRSVQYSPDGAHIISGSDADCGSAICIWNASDGTLCAPPLQAHTDDITSIAISPEGGRIASGSIDRTICVWSKHTGELIAGPFNGHTGVIRYVGFSDGGMRILSASEDKTIRVWNAHGSVQQANSSMNEITTMRHNCISSPDQTQIATIINSGIYIWDLRTTALVTTAESKDIPSINFLQFSLDGTRLFTVNDSSEICTWDTRTAELIDGPYVCSTNRGYPPSASCSIDGTRVVTCHGGKFELWDSQSHRSIAYCDTGIEDNNSAAFDSEVKFSRGGRRFITRVSITKRPPSHTTLMPFVWDEGKETHTCLHVWDADSGICIAGPIAATKVFDISPSGTSIVCYNHTVDDSERDCLQLINLHSGEVTFMTGMPHRHAASNAKFSSDSLHVSCHTSTTCYIWNVGNHAVTAIRLTEFGGLVSFGSSPSGRCLASIMNGHLLQVRSFHISQPHCMIVSSDGWLLDAGSRPVLWLPRDIRSEFPKSSGIMINCKNGEALCVDYECMFVGDDWNKCYIGD